MLTYILLFLIRLIIIIATWGSMRDKGRCIVSTSFIWRVVSDWCCVMCFFYDIDIIMTIWCRGVWLLMRGKRSSNCSPTAFNLFTYLTLICVLAVMKCTPNTPHQFADTWYVRPLCDVVVHTCSVWVSTISFELLLLVSSISMFCIELANIILWWGRGWLYRSWDRLLPILVKALRPRRLAEYISILLSCLFTATLALLSSVVITPSPLTPLSGCGYISEGATASCVIRG